MSGERSGVRELLQAELTLTPDGWRRGVRVVVGSDGRIAAVEPAAPGSGPGSVPTPEGAPLRSLPGRALLPGMINAHSHAFQRGLRGKGERFEAGRGSFWSWREAMYELVEQLDVEGVHDLSRRAFAEMRRAGITSVGEFHYLHHGRERWAFDEAVLAAAREVGIRIVLLQAFYRTGGIGEPLRGGQLRFATPSATEYWDRFDGLASGLSAATQSLGVVAHSIRAVQPFEIAEFQAEATRRGLVFHMHLEEQPAEIEACLHEYGATPMALVNRELEVNDRTTMVHCTHTDPNEMARYLESGGIVCICPLTEGNLGDGLADVPGILAAGGTICLGTDSNARIGMLEEMRLLEYGQRLVSGSRGVVVDGAGRVAEGLWACATRSGARSLGLDAGAIEPGRLADFALVDLTHPALAGVAEEDLLAALILGAPDDAIVGSAVGGEWA